VLGHTVLSGEVAADWLAKVAAGEPVAGPALAEEEQAASEAGEEPGAERAAGSVWMLDVLAASSRDVKVYEQRRKRAVLDALDEVRGGRRLSRRVVGIWAYQEGERVTERRSKFVEEREVSHD
jgi:hypothetical protein